MDVKYFTIKVSHCGEISYNEQDIATYSNLHEVSRPRTIGKNEDFQERFDDERLKKTEAKGINDTDVKCRRNEKKYRNKLSKLNLRVITRLIDNNIGLTMLVVVATLILFVFECVSNLFGALLFLQKQVCG